MKKIKKLFIGIAILVMCFSIFSLSAQITNAAAIGGACNTADPCTEGAVCGQEGNKCDCRNNVCVRREGAPDPITVACDTAEGIDGIICKVIGTMGIIFSLLLALAVLYFVWGVVQYVTAGGDEEKSAAGKKTMMYAIIALAVLVGVYGLILLVTNYLGLGELVTLPFIQ